MMGTRICFDLICGAEVVKEPDDWWLDREIPHPAQTQVRGTAHEIKRAIQRYIARNPSGADALFFNHSLPGVYGTYIERGPYGSEISLAMAAVFGAFREAAWIELPRYRDFEFPTTYSRQLKRYDRDLEYGTPINIPGLFNQRDKPRRKRNEHDYQWWSWEWPTEVAKTLYILNWAGFKVKRRDLKLMLVWTWS